MPRPKLQPTEEQRKRVKSLVAVGVPHEEIARQIGVRSPKTLRKHFRDELDRGQAEANASIAGALYNKAMGGDTSAQKFWLMCRAGWRPRPTFDPGSSQPPPLVIGVATGGSLT
jgi:hypothetical protein